MTITLTELFKSDRLKHSRREPGTKKNGGPFDPLILALVWNKAQPAGQADPRLYRLDCKGALIRRSDYGKRTETGWEVDHRVALANGGGDQLDNLQPLHWENNRAKSDHEADDDWTPAVTFVTQFEDGPKLVVAPIRR
jgi:hypothetical protein